MLKKCVNLHEIWSQIATIGVKPLTSIIIERVNTQPRLSLIYAVYNSACILPGARGGRGVRAVGVATLNANFRKKKAKDKRKKWAVQR